MGNRAGRRGQPQPIPYNTTTTYIAGPGHRHGGHRHGGHRPACPGYGRQRNPYQYPQYPGMQPYY